VIEFEKIVAATDVSVADENLRNRASIAAGNHFLAQLRIVFDIDFAENHILAGQ
jgi:hypothetical protein